LQVEKDLDILIKEIGEARIVLLGESTHGTHEFYEWRSALTKKLIEEKGFDFIAIEGDWVDSYKVNQFIKGQQQDSSSVIELLKQYDRWPSSMWGNYEMAGLVQWLNSYNQTGDQQKQDRLLRPGCIQFLGMDEPGYSVQHAAFQNAIKQVRESFADYNNDALKYATAVRKTKANHSASTQNLWSIVQKDIEQQPKR
jgi:erythromycin esterase-like protein